MKRTLTKYFDLKYDWAEVKRRFYWLQSKSKQKKSLSFLSKVNDEPFLYPPIFVIGPPRSGSTLLYQIMIHRYRFCYLQNRMENHRFSIPLYIKKYVDAKEKYSSDFSSKLGKTELLNGPHEGGYFWRRFYPRDIHDYVAEHQLSKREEDEIRNTIKFLQMYFNAPFLSKNMEISVRLKSIQKFFPEAVFILMIRDPRATASSLLKARIDYFGSKDTWWSIRPKEYFELLNEPNHIQIAYQVTNIYKAVLADFDQRFPLIKVSYEQLCENPAKIMNELRNQLAGIGINLEDNILALPENFSAKTSFLFDEKELSDIEDIFMKEKLYELLYSS